jgi:protein N-terminal methyltransferase
LIVVKENVCDDISGEPPMPTEVLDDEDSSLTRSELKWLEIFKAVGVRVVKEEVQLGLPAGLFVVKAWALAPM